MRVLAAVALVVLVLPPLAAAGVQEGTYVVLDGPRAGIDVHVSGSGKAFVTGQKSSLRVEDADEECDRPYLRGTIGGRLPPGGPCGWGRLLAVRGADRVVVDVAYAVTEEERALAPLEEEPPKAPHWSLLLYGSTHLGHVLDELDEAQTAGKIAAGPAGKIRRRLRAAKEIDDRWVKRLHANKNLDAAGRKLLERDIRNALDLKRAALPTIEDAFVAEPEAKRCAVEKEFDVFAIPAGYQSAHAEVFPHGVPRSAKHVRVRFVNAATGKPVPHEAFPEQTWTSEIKSFRADRTLRVRVDLSGTGFGEPDAHAEHWRAIVSFDC